ncbi:MAG: polyhydroxyalkanoate biosynthesis repressor PhaR [Rhodospirillaceae bacterium]|nr:polyhydroxyalkanoate biosynthesis repressor PhaR [Rhodospirillaceae bacterium]
MDEFVIGDRRVSPDQPPLVIAEIGINHEGDFEKAVRMIDDAAAAGCECVKFQCHVIEDEMIPNDVIPGNADESIWDIMDRCKLSLDEDRRLRDYAVSKGMIYLSTPFSRAAANQLEAMGVAAYKIGSGECNNYPLIKHIAGFGKPIILSTGMNDIASIRPAWGIMQDAGVACVLMHCTSMYPTPYEAVRLGALAELRQAFSTDMVGLSDHSLGNYSCFAAAALGACVLERHFTSDKSWPGPDVPISMDPPELADLIAGSRAIHAARGGAKEILGAEQPTIDFAYATVVTLRAVSAGEIFSEDNIWVKRPGTGEIKAKDFESLLGRTAQRDIAANHHVAWDDLT